MVKPYGQQLVLKNYSLRSSEFLCLKEIGSVIFIRQFQSICRVEESEYFERDGADIYTEAVISVSQAILGGSLRIEGIYEDQMVEVYLIDFSCYLFELFYQNYNIRIYFDIDSSGYIITRTYSSCWQRLEESQRSRRWRSLCFYQNYGTKTID